MPKTCAAAVVLFCQGAGKNIDQLHCLFATFCRIKTGIH